MRDVWKFWGRLDGAGEAAGTERFENIDQSMRNRFGCTGELILLLLLGTVSSWW